MATGAVATASQAEATKGKKKKEKKKRRKEEEKRKITKEFKSTILLNSVFDAQINQENTLNDKTMNNLLQDITCFYL